jgi:4-hydroxy-tetrahydrodipicolinate reductase
MSIKISIVGASGRMGRTLIETVLAATDCSLVSATDRSDNASIGTDAASFLGKNTGVFISSDVESSFKLAQTIIDFTSPKGTLEHLEICQKLGISAVIGTTGFNPQQLQHIKEFSTNIPIVLAPNMSIGVNVTLKLLEMAGKALSDGYDVEVMETHHKHKVDSPSGTAIKMGEVVANAQGKSLADCAVYERHGLIGARTSGSIGFSSVRGGDVIGDHTVLFAGAGDRVEITHKSSSRKTYAQGSLQAVRFLQNSQNGLYDMFDVLGFK